MSVRKISAALDESTPRAALDAATRNGVSLSSWLNQAAERALRVEEGLRAVQEWEAQHGALTASELAAADRFPAGCEVKPLTETQARVAGSLLARTRTTDIVEASVVVVARERGDQVLTSDPNDLSPLSAALGRPLVTVRSIGDLRP